jgi:hypothetical protein
MKQWPSKDPNEVVDYQLDWADPKAPRLQASEMLTSSTWSVVTGDVVISMSPIPPAYTAGGLSTVWLTGGSPSTKCELLNRVTTSLGRTYDQTVRLRIRNH